MLITHTCWIMTNTVSLTIWLTVYTDLILVISKEVAIFPVSQKNIVVSFEA